MTSTWQTQAAREQLVRDTSANADQNCPSCKGTGIAWRRPRGYGSYRVLHAVCRCAGGVCWRVES